MPWAPKIFSTAVEEVPLADEAWNHLHSVIRVAEGEREAGDEMEEEDEGRDEE